MTLAAVFLCCAATMMAEPVSPKTAREAAAKFLQAKGSRLKSEAMRARNRIMGSGAESEGQTEASPYYVFNASAARGFVVISGDDCIGENLVLGYTAQGSFDANAVPGNMQWWLDEMGNQIAELSRRGAKAKAVELHEDINPLVTALWDQGSPTYDPKNPYNALCPEMDGALCVTGCMATALAQVMYYHRWPLESAAPTPGYTSTNGTNIDELPVTAFDWQNMVDNYTEETTEEQKYAVATLMRYCGQIVRTDYTPLLSSGYYYDVDMLVKLFGYDQGVYQACADFYTVNGWDMLIYNELKEGRPLVYSGVSNGGGHAFVVDGYKVLDGSGFFHVNWGWSGLDNGYFRIALLDSQAQGTGSSSTRDGYNFFQHALIGLQPAKGPLANYGRYLVAENWNTTIEDIPNSFGVVNTSYYPGTYAIQWVERTDDGQLDFHDFAYGETMEFPGYNLTDFSSWISFTLPKDFEGLAPGRHEMVIMHKELGTDAPWKPLYGPNNYIEIQIDEEGQLAETIFHPLPQLSTTTSEIIIDGIKQRGLRQNVSFPINNSSDDDYTGVVLCTTYKYDGTTLGEIVDMTYTGIMIEAGGTEELAISLSIPVTGSLMLVLTKGEEIMNLEGTKEVNLSNIPGYIGSKTFTIDELAFYCLDAQYNERPNTEGNPAYYLDLILDNATSMTYNAVVLARLYKPNDEGGYDLMTFPSRPYLYSFMRLNDNSRGTVSIQLPEPLESGEYGLELLIANDFNSNLATDYFVFASRLITVESSTGVSEISDDSKTSVEKWFDLNGRKLSGKPASKGVYILNGKKQLIK